MRFVCLLLALGLALGPGAVIGARAAFAQFVKYRTAEGSIGFAQDESGVPPGATVIPSAARKQLQVFDESTTRGPGPDMRARVQNAIDESPDQPRVAHGAPQSVLGGHHASQRVSKLEGTRATL